MTERRLPIRLGLLAMAFSQTLGDASPALAGFYNNRADWVKQLDSSKRVYVMGIVDGWEFYNLNHDRTNKPDEPFHLMVECIGNKNIKSGEIVDLIDNFYSDPANWDRSPVSGLSQSLRRRCGF